MLIPFNCNYNLLFYTNFLFQISSRIVFLLSIVPPIFFILLPFLQYWVFRLYHRIGHPWSQILASTSKQNKESCQSKILNNLKKKFNKSDQELVYFQQFWKQQESGTKTGHANPHYD